MTGNERFKVTNISNDGNTGLFWLGKDNLSVYDVVRLLNELYDENKEFNEKYDAQRYLYGQLNSDYNNLREENKELKTELLDVLEQLFNAESSLIHEYSTTISQDEEELREYFKQKYRKYGWKE